MTLPNTPFWRWIQRRPVATVVDPDYAIDVLDAEARPPAILPPLNRLQTFTAASADPAMAEREVYGMIERHLLFAAAPSIEVHVACVVRWTAGLTWILKEHPGVADRLELVQMRPVWRTEDYQAPPWRKWLVRWEVGLRAGFP